MCVNERVGNGRGGRKSSSRESRGLEREKVMGEEVKEGERGGMEMCVIERERE